MRQTVSFPDSGIAVRRAPRGVMNLVTTSRLSGTGRFAVECRRAMTLVELLLVIGVVGVVVAMLLPVLAGARKASGRVSAMSDVRQLLLGHARYHLEHQGALLWGYTPPTVNGVPVTVSDPVSGFEFSLPVADRYPWRLIRYTGNLWALLHGRDHPPAPLAGDTPQLAVIRAYHLSIFPLYGINAVFVGGHAGFGGFGGPTGDAPMVGRSVAFRAADIPNASRQIVFAETQVTNVPGIAPGSGFHFVMPPKAAGFRWTVEASNFVLQTGTIIGLPRGRHGPTAAVGFFDGHVRQLAPPELTDMRLWAPKATDPDADIRLP